MNGDLEKNHIFKDSNKIGIIIAPTTTYYIKFVLLRDKMGRPINVNRGDFVIIKNPQNEAGSPFILGRITNYERKSIMLDEDMAPYLSQTDVSLRDLRETGFRPDISEFAIAEAEIIGWRTRKTFIRPRVPPTPGEFVYKPPSEVLRKVFALGKGLFLGFLRSNPNVPVYLDPQELVTKHCAILAMTGSGKSWTAAVMIEELYRVYRELPIVIFDPHGEYVSLAQYMSREEIYSILKWRCGKPPSEYEYFLDEIFDSKLNEKIIVYTPQPKTIKTLKLKMLEKKLGKEFIEKRVKELYIQLADLDLYQLTEILSTLYGLTDAQKRILEAIWSEVHKRAERDEEVFIEEIKERIDKVSSELVKGEYPSRLLKSKIEMFAEHRSFIAKAPEDYRKRIKINDIVKKGQISVIDLSGMSIYDQQIVASVIARKILQNRILRKIPPVFIILEEAHRFAPAGSSKSLSRETFKHIAQEGRKFLVGLCVISQRPSRVHDDILSQCNTQIILRLTNPDDQNYVRKISEYISAEDLEEIKMLAPGEAMIFGPSVVLPAVAIIRPRVTVHGGISPSIFDELKEYKEY